MAYAELERRFHHLTDLDGAIEMLHWDQAAKMPRGGSEARAGQIAALRRARHEALTAPDTGELLDRAADESLDTWQAANLHAMRREWVHNAAVPADLVEELSTAASRCEAIWRDARAEGDFAVVADALERVVTAVRRQAEAVADSLGCAPYEALLDAFDPELRLETVERVLGNLETEIPPLLDRARAHQEAAPEGPGGPFPVPTQQAVARDLMQGLGFDFEHGRLDVSAHPFTGGVPDDVRVTSRYDGDSFAPGIMATLHETGHALYEQGLPRAWRGQPVGRAPGMILHESQALIMEMQVGRSRAFHDFLAPRLRDAFGGSGPAWNPDRLYRRHARVEPGFIRVDADEVCYPLHVALRYRLERALVEGRMAVRDVPEAWHEGMRARLGLTPPDDGLGCLQDIHWYDGGFGYFPTYTLGAVAAAQLFRAACEAAPEIPDRLHQGETGPLLGWLRRWVHARGSVLGTEALLTEATGRGLDVAPFLDHLRARYLSEG